MQENLYEDNHVFTIFVLTKQKDKNRRLLVFLHVLGTVPMQPKQWRNTRVGGHNSSLAEALIIYLCLKRRELRLVLASRILVFKNLCIIADE